MHAADLIHCRAATRSLPPAAAFFFNATTEKSMYEHPFDAIFQKIYGLLTSIVA